jgi:hypothetical protein
VVLVSSPLSIPIAVGFRAVEFGHMYGKVMYTVVVLFKCSTVVVLFKCSTVVVFCSTDGIPVPVISGAPVPVGPVNPLRVEFDQRLIEWTSNAERIDLEGIEPEGTGMKVGKPGP